MLRDFIGWSATHPSSASDYLTPASLIKLAALLAALGGLLLAARGARRVARSPRADATRCGCCWPRRPSSPSAGAVVLAPIAYAVRLPQSPLNTSAVTRAAAALATPRARADGGSPWLSLDDALGSLRRLTHTAPFDRIARVGRRGSRRRSRHHDDGDGAGPGVRAASAARRPAASSASVRTPWCRRATTPRIPTAATRCSRSSPAPTRTAGALLLQELGASGGQRAVLRACRPTSAAAASTCRASTRSSWTTGCTARSAPAPSTSPTGTSTTRCAPAPRRGPTPCCAISAATGWTRRSATACDALLIGDLQALERAEGGHHPHHRRRRPLRRDVLPGDRAWPVAAAAAGRRRRPGAGAGR